MTIGMGGRQVPETYRRLIPETPVQGKPLGRHVNHDPRSLRFLVGAPARALKSVQHERVIPVLDQGSLGMCTGAASTGAVGTAPLFTALPADHPTLDIDYARGVYSDATRVDPFPGEYPPDDTGSDGLSVAKVLKNRGLISGYLHATSLSAMQAALQDTPVIVGTYWYSGMDEPDAKGFVSVTGSVRGGHEYEVVGIDVDAEVFTCVNSWGTSFGLGGYFKVRFADMDRLLGEEGDCTQLLPLTVAPPAPAPVDKDLAAWWAFTRSWANRWYSAKVPAQAARDLARAKGLT